MSPTGIRRAFGRGRSGSRRTIPVAAAPSWSACYAPHSSIYFDQLGKARACCQNTGVYLGDVTTQTIREIWESADAEQLRSAVEIGDYSAGCEFCEWQVREGNEEILFARQYDGLQPAEHRPAWPVQMEFALTNTCNLQCAMCNGEWSSAIRSRREHLPPLAAAYGEAFFDELAEFLPHLRDAKFAGGEPFLGAEPLRVMEMLAELDEPPRVTIITNGTQWTPRVERIVAALRPYVIVSIDGASTERYDAIRVGAHLPDVLANLDRFRAELGPDHVSITTCLMTGNWDEFADLLALAEARDLDVGVNVVRFPEEHSLYQLPAADLRPVVDALAATRVELTGPRLAAWEHHRAALAHRLAVLDADPGDLGPAHGLPGVTSDGPSMGPSNGPSMGPPLDPMPTSRWAWLPFPEQATPSAGTDVPPSDGPEAHLAVDLDGTLTVIRLDPGTPLDLDGLDGASVADLAVRLADAFPDPDAWITLDRLRPADDDRAWVLLARPGERPTAEMVVTSVRDDTGALVGGRATFRAATRDVPARRPVPAADGTA